jgi:hypothetical protein
MDYSPKFLKKLKSINAKRAKTVIDHILENGFITTEELKEKYGYNHPPRAVCDVREQDILSGFVLVASLGTNHAKPFGPELQVKQMLG